MITTYDWSMHYNCWEYIAWVCSGLAVNRGQGGADNDDDDLVFS